jgi:hypothetical protein
VKIENNLILPDLLIFLLSAKDRRVADLPDAHRQDAVGSHRPQLMGDWVHGQTQRLERFDAQKCLCAFGCDEDRDAGFTPGELHATRQARTPLEDVVLRMLSAEDMLHAKLRAATDSALRKSKRLRDLADAQALVERHPVPSGVLSPHERALLDRAG